MAYDIQCSILFGARVKYKSVLITGGTGSFGKAMVKRLLADKAVQRLVVFSRDELKQSEMAQEFDPNIHTKIRFFIGDIRDKNRLMDAFEGIDLVIHAAALKQVPAAEYNPFEFIKTNVLGSQHVIECARAQEVKHVVALSTDKASSPVNLYGATKLCSDKLFVAANFSQGSKNCKFSVVRYGNVFGSRGSVFPFFHKRKKSGMKIPVTHIEMSRFNISLNEGLNMVLHAATKSVGGEVFIPKLKSYYIRDVLAAMGIDDYEITGIRPGEKLHEEMLSLAESENSIETENGYIILPATLPKSDFEMYAKHHGGKFITKAFSYSSGTNEERLSIAQLKVLIDRQFNSLSP